MFPLFTYIVSTKCFCTETLDHVVWGNHRWRKFDRSSSWAASNHSIDDHHGNQKAFQENVNGTHHNSRRWKRNKNDCLYHIFILLRSYYEAGLSLNFFGIFLEQTFVGSWNRRRIRPAIIITLIVWRTYANMAAATVSPMIHSAPKSSGRHFVFPRKCVSLELCM